MQLGSVQSLFRYPVKSLRGNACDQLAFDRRGAHLDRLFSVVTADGKLGSHKGTPWFRALPGLFDLQAEVVGEQVQVLLPDGRRLSSDAPELATAITEIVGQPVSLAKEADQSHFDDGATHLLTTSSLQWLSSRLPDSQVDPRRFRPNIVINSTAPGLA
ncbi:MAG: MOSC N-terminal beta barrel domain-containing protein [Burkholderiaceae bacterium]